MRPQLGIGLLMSAITGVGVHAGPGDAQIAAKGDNVHFLRIAAPHDGQVFKPEATSVAVGLLQLSESRKDVSSLVIRARVYRQKGRSFIVDNSSYGELKKPIPGTNRYPFQASVVLPAEAGTYLLKLDCIDPLGAKVPR